MDTAQSSPPDPSSPNTTNSETRDRQAEQAYAVEMARWESHKRGHTLTERQLIEIPDAKEKRPRFAAPGRRMFCRPGRSRLAQVVLPARDGGRAATQHPCGRPIALTVSSDQKKRTRTIWDLRFTGVYDRTRAARRRPASAACRLATSPKQIKELWSKVAELLNDEQTKLQRDVIAIPPVED